MNSNVPNTCQKCGKPILEGSPRGLCALCLISAVAKSDEPMPTDAPSPELDDLRSAFPQLEILEPLGAGGMGRVYKVRQPHLDRIVALKLLPPAYAADPEWIERFTREGRALARLNHPNIVQVFDFGEAGARDGAVRFPFLLMEFVDGVNLRQALRNGALTAREALTIVPSVCAALQYAHDEGVLHRDIKPENILLDTQGRVKIADFGLAKLRGDSAPGLSLTATGVHLGTAAYMAPEQIERPQSVDHRADIYSLGVVFYELLTGELPLGRFAAPSERAGTDPRLDTIVFRTLEKERERRFQSATDMRTEVENVASTPPPSTTAASPALVPAPRARRVALIGAWLHLVPLILGVCFLPIWFDIAASAADRHGLTFAEAFVRFGTKLAALIIPAALALIAGDVLTLVALLGHRYRARWFFWWNVFHWSALSLVLVGILPLIYTLAKWREFFPRHVGESTTRAPVPGLNPWPRRVFLLIIALVIAPIALIGVGLIVPYFAARAPRAALGRSPAADVVTPERAPFVGRLPEGTVELVAVSHHPSDGEAWWRMDGSPATVGPFVNRGARANASAGERGYEFVFQIKNLPAGATLKTWEVENSYGWASGDTPELATAPGKPLADHHALAATLPATLRAADIRVGVGFGEWETIFASGQGGPGSTSPTHKGVMWRIGWSAPLETRDGETVSNWTVSRHADWETRVVAVKLDGTEMATSNRSAANDQTTWQFTGLPMAQVKDFRLQVRRVQWIEFRGIALRPAS